MVSQKKQVKRLKKDAQRIWSDQQALLGRANSAARDAVPHAQHYAKDRIESVGPNAQKLYEHRVVPAAKAGAKASRAAGAYAGSTARDAARGVLLPAATSSLTAALAIANEAGERLGLGGSDLQKQGEKAQKQLGKVTRSGRRSEAKARVKLKAAGKAGRAAAKHGSKRIAKATGHDSGIGVGGVLGILLGVGLLAGIGYAIWQTLRADDDLWVADEDPETTPTGDAPTA